MIFGRPAKRIDERPSLRKSLLFMHDNLTILSDLSIVWYNLNEGVEGSMCAFRV